MNRELDSQRLGLALSGGGFRASFFHIGILARMAELDMLCEVESISTVSGGSIIGVYYYLCLKRLLEDKSDNEITRQDYIDIIKKIERDFLDAVQLNLRTRTFSSVFHNIKMVFSNYSRSDRIGELYDKLMYQPLIEKSSEETLWVSDLKIFPKNDVNANNFNPTQGHNDVRKNKVPIININATVLNTGHNWRFTAVDMGEVVHDDALSLNIDKNTRLLKGKYSEICGKEFPLGKAVAASACVPGIFTPLAVSKMYDWKIQLVDGGVYDNQAIEALQNDVFPCSRIIISDASGQMRDNPAPETGTLSTFMRVTDVLMGRVREEMLGRVSNEKSVCLMHLKDGLDVFKKAPKSIDCSQQIDPQRKNDVIGKLSRIRTDLDSFSDVEAVCLMARGYSEAKQHVDVFHQNARKDESKSQWFFSQAEPWLTSSETAPANLDQQLDAAEHKFGKYFRLGWSRDFVISALTFFGCMLVYVFVVGVVIEYLTGGICDAISFLKEMSLLEGLGYLAIIGLGFVFERIGKVFKILKFLRYPYKFVSSLVIRFIFPVLGALPIKLYLMTLNKYYLRQGSLRKN